jgi:2-polyprenyl-3-methyl-5-hydroxy-6-metoxy-1,4-benzoquinol methylase
MPDSQIITSNLVDMYSRNNFLMRLNLRCFIWLSGLRRVSRRSKVLDCGCAMGHLIRALRAYGFDNLVGIDASAQMAEGARATTGILVMHADVGTLSRHISPGEFDVIIASGLIHHLTTVADWENFIADCHRGLKEGGLLVIREPWPTLPVRVMRWMARHKVFDVGFLKAQFKSLREEDGLVRYFFKFWVGSHKDLIIKHGFSVTKDFIWLVHRITLCRKTAAPNLA